MADVFYRYLTIPTFQVSSQKMTFRPFKVKSITEDCDYFSNFIPVITMVCQIEDKYLNLLRLYDKEMIVRLKKVLKSGPSAINMTDEEILSDDVYIAFYDKNSLPNISSGSKNVSSFMTEFKEEYDIDSMPHNPIDIRIHLVLQKDLVMKTYIHNYVFGTEEKPVTPLTAAVACIEDNPYIGSYLVDPPDNTLKYTDLIIEQAELKNALRSIQHRYGIYSKGLLLFYYNDILYMLNKCHTSHSQIKNDINEIITIRIDERVDRVNPTQSAAIINKGKDIIYERATTMKKMDYESIEGVIHGDAFVFSNFGSIINSGFGNDGKTSFVSPLTELTKPKKNRQDVGIKKIVDYDLLNNPFNMSSYMYEQSIGTVVNSNIAAINVKHFAPNKRVRLVLDSSESRKLYSGIYNIYRCQFMYYTTNEQGKPFDMYCHANLTLFNKTEGYDKDYEIETPK